MLNWRTGIIVAAIFLSSSAFAAGIDSRTATCGQLQALIASRGYIFIAQPFGDFVVANGSLCSGGERLQTRSVPTIDNPQCPVNYCIPIFRNND